MRFFIFLRFFQKKECYTETSHLHISQYVVLFDGKSLSKKVTDAQTRTQSAYTSGPRDFNIKKEVFFDPDPANFPNYEGLYPDFPDIDKRYVSKGTWTGAEYSRFMHTAVDLAQMDSDDLRLKACKYLVRFMSQRDRGSTDHCCQADLGFVTH